MKQAGESGMYQRRRHTLEVDDKGLVSMKKHKINRISVKCRWGGFCAKLCY